MTFRRFMLTGALLIATGLSRVVYAQPAPDPAPDPAPERDTLPGLAHEKAVQTFKEGIAAFDRRDFEAARVAFLQTFALKPSAPVVRRNLGLAEIYSGYYLEGARRLARVIHTTDEGTPQDRARMVESLKKAEVHLERITLEVNVDGAQIVVGDVDLGVSPLPFAWYVPPGAYEVRVTKAGFDPFFVTRDGRAGSIQHLRIALKETAAPPVVPPPAPMSSVDRAVRSGPNPWVVATGGMLTAGGVAVGVTLGLLAADNTDKVDRLRNALSGVNCRSTPGVAGCAELSNAAAVHDRQVRWATVSFAAAGVAGVSTLLYALLANSDNHDEDPAVSRARSELERTFLAMSVDRAGAQVTLHTWF